MVVTPAGVRPTITVPTKYPKNEEQQEKTSDDEETSTNEDEESTDGDREMSVGNLFSVFHYPVRMAELFENKKLGHS